MELLERQANLAELSASWAEARTGSGRITLVSGEAGIGKTSLVQAFTRSLGKSVRVLWGVCDALFTPRPLGPLHDMADQVQGDIPELLQTDSNRARLFSAVLAECKRQPTIAVFEDVHWADEATLDLLRYLGRRISQTSTLLIMTYRDDELGARHPLLTVLGDLAVSTATRRIPLAPLSVSAVLMLVKGRGMDASLLHHQSGGNPFYITEVLASQGSGIPASIRDAVLARTARLSLSGRAVLEAAAIIGMRVDPWLLKAATGAEASAVDENIEAGILLPQGNVLAFRHDLTRQIILGLISPQRRPVLHGLVLEALRSSPATRNDLARLAHHAEGSGDHQSVLEYAPAAAQQAAAAGAHREATALYALALSYAEHLQRPEYASMLVDYARECNVTEKQADGIEAQRKAAQVWEQLHEPAKQAATLAILAIMLRNYGKNAEAEKANRAGLALLEGLPPAAELALVYRVQATLSLSRRNYDEAITWGEKAIALSKSFGDENNLAMTHVAVGSAWLFLDYERGRAYLEERLQIARDAGQERHIANLYAYIGSCSTELYRFQEAEQYLAEGIAFTADRGLDIFTRYMLAWQTLTYIHQGSWEEANEFSNMLMRNPGFPAISRITALAATGRLRTRRGEPGAGGVLDEALAIASETETLQYLGLVRSVRAEAAWLAGDHSGVVEEARAAYDLALSKRHPWLAGELAFWRWKAGDEVDVTEWMARPFSLHIAGEWQAAADEWQRLGCPYEQARALADGDAQAQRAALHLFERLGAHPAAEMLRQKMRVSGAPKIPHKPRSATRDNPFSLTDRQVQILALLIEGLSNAEISARLYISPKTTDHHVSAVLARLNVHSREDAAALARQHPYFSK